MTHEIRDLWEAHVAAPFPGRFRDEEVDGIDLVMLDADIAGCVSTFLSRDGALDAGRFRSLRLRAAEAVRFLSAVDDPQGLRYVARLLELARRVLRECDARRDAGGP